MWFKMEMLCILNSMSSLVKVGKIINTFGIKGQIKIWSQTENIEKLYTSISNIKIIKLKLHKPNIFIASVENCQSCNDAELLIGTELFIEKSCFPRKNSSDLYEFDVIGWKVYSKFDLLNPIGILEDFIYHGKSKSIVVKLLNPGDNRFQEIIQDNQILILRDFVIFENGKVIIDNILS